MSEFHYPLIFHEEIGSIGVSFPDFPGCVTSGEHIKDAVENAKEALGLHITGIIEDGENLPEPTSIRKILDVAAAANAVAMYISVSL